MADIAERLRLLEDKDAIVARLHEITASIDGEAVAPWLDCYTADGAFSAGDVGRPPAIDLQGRAAMERWFGEHRTLIAVATQKHVLLNPRVTLAGDVARAHSSFLTLRPERDAIVVTASGSYDDRLVRCTDGGWRIAERHAQANMRAAASVPQPGTER